MKTQYAIIAIIAILALAAGGLALWILLGNTPSNESGQVYCAQDVNLCPDGSYVSRIPPACEFALCMP